MAFSSTTSNLYESKSKKIKAYAAGMFLDAYDYAMGCKQKAEAKFFKKGTRHRGDFSPAPNLFHGRFPLYGGLEVSEVLVQGSRFGALEVEGLTNVSKNARGRPRLAPVAFGGRYMGLTLNSKVAFHVHASTRDSRMEAINFLSAPNLRPGHFKVRT
jgi:hypothetical protein